MNRALFYLSARPQPLFLLLVSPSSIASHPQPLPLHHITALKHRLPLRSITIIVATPTLSFPSLLISSFLHHFSFSNFSFPLLPPHCSLISRPHKSTSYHRSPPYALISVPPHLFLSPSLPVPSLSSSTHHNTAASSPFLSHPLPASFRKPFPHRRVTLSQ